MQTFVFLNGCLKDTGLILSVELNQNVESKMENVESKI